MAGHSHCRQFERSTANRHTPGASAGRRKFDPHYTRHWLPFIGTWVLRELNNRGLNAVVLDAGGAPPVGRASSVFQPKRCRYSREIFLIVTCSRTFSSNTASRVIHLAPFHAGLPD
jgi:hypothetical protein